MYSNLVGYISCLFLNTCRVYDDHKEYIFILCVYVKIKLQNSQSTKPLATNLSRNFTQVEKNANYYILCIWICN